MTRQGYLLVTEIGPGAYRGVDRHPISVYDIASNQHLSVPELVDGARNAAHETQVRELLLLNEPCLLERKEQVDCMTALARQSYPMSEVLRVARQAPTDARDLCVAQGAPVDGQEFLGVDVAYGGGDYYSAVKQGMFVGPVSDSFPEHRKQLNSSGLFDSLEQGTRYLADFLTLAKSEREEDFQIYFVSIVRT